MAEKTKQRQSHLFCVFHRCRLLSHAYILVAQNDQDQQREPKHLSVHLQFHVVIAGRHGNAHVLTVRGRALCQRVRDCQLRWRVAIVAHTGPARCCPGSRRQRTVLVQLDVELNRDVSLETELFSVNLLLIHVHSFANEHSRLYHFESFQNRAQSTQNK